MTYGRNPFRFRVSEEERGEVGLLDRPPEVRPEGEDWRLYQAAERIRQGEPPPPPPVEEELVPMWESITEEELSEIQRARWKQEEAETFIPFAYGFEAITTKAEQEKERAGLPEPIRSLAKFRDWLYAPQGEDQRYPAEIISTVGLIGVLIGTGIIVGVTGWDMLLNRALSKPGELNKIGRVLTRAGLKREFGRYMRQTGTKIDKVTQDNFINRYLKDMAAYFESSVKSQTEKGTLNIPALQQATVATYNRAVERFNQTFVPKATQTGAMVTGGIGKPAEVIKVLPSVQDTQILNTAQALGKTIGLDVEAIGGISPGEYWVSITTPALKVSDAFAKWLTKFPTETASELRRLLEGKFEVRTTTGIEPGKRFLPFKNILDANKFLETGDTSLIAKTITQRGEPWTPEQLAQAREGMARMPATGVVTPEPSRGTPPPRPFRPTRGRTEAQAEAKLEALMSKMTPEERATFQITVKPEAQVTPEVTPPAIVPTEPTAVTPPVTPEVTAIEGITKAEFVEQNADLVVKEKGRWGTIHYALKTRTGDYQKVGQITSDSPEGVLEQLYDKKVAIPKAEVTPPVTEVVPEGVTPTEPVVTPTAEILATQGQKAQAHIVAHDKALVDPKTGKTTPQYRRLAQNITGKKSMKEMTSDEAVAFIEALEKYPERKWSPKTGKWIPQSMPITKAIVPENYFNIKFGEPTPIKYFTSQNFYAAKLGVGELTRPLELAKQKLDLEFPAWTKAVESKIGELNKVYKVTTAEKFIAIRNNLPTRAVSEMAKLLNKYEDLPPEVAAELGENKVKLFSWFRNVDRTILSGENGVRELLNMPLIPHRQAYLRHIADQTAREVMQGNYSLPQDLAYWSKQIVGKKIFNPMAMHRKLSDDLLVHFSKDLNYVTRSMIWTGLKEIHLSQPLQAFTSQLNVLSKGMMPFSSLTGEELARAQAVQSLPASTRKWLVDYVNQVIKGQQTELDASINRVITQTGIGGVLDKLLGEFGRSVGTRPVSQMAQFTGRLNILATIGTKPRQIIRNLFQTTQNLALYGIEPTLQAELPAGKTLSRLLNNSLFLKSYARYEELPTSAMGKVERAWMWAYGKSAIINARKGMKASFYGTIDYITNPKNKGLGWADPARTGDEPKGFLYPSESEKLLREMEFGSGCTQYQYIAMGMPEVFRHKVLIPFTRLQSWWMNYFAKFNREALHRFWNGSVGWDTSLKIPPSARLNWMKYLILGGGVLTALGYKRSFMKDVLPHWGSPAAQFATGAYNYIIADKDYEREKAKRTMFYSIKAFVPGAIDYASWEAVWTGEKSLSSLFFYGEEWPPEMPTWGIPALEAEVDIKNAIEFANEEIPEFRKKLGQDIPAEDDIEAYTYEMSDFGVEIRASIRDLPPERITKDEGFSDVVLMYKKAETLWETNYYSLPASARQEWLQQQTPESIWTGAYLALWGKLKVTGWVSGNPSTIALIRQLKEEYNIPDEAIPSLSEYEERGRGTGGGVIPSPPTRPTRPSGGGVNPFR